MRHDPALARAADELRLATPVRRFRAACSWLAPLRNPINAFGFVAVAVALALVPGRLVATWLGAASWLGLGS